MKITLRLAALWLFAVILFGSSLPTFAAMQCQDLFPPEKEIVNNAGETLEELAIRLQTRQQLELRIGTDRVISINYIPAAKDQPTFLFLPGVNRSLSIDEPDAKILSRMGNGLITFDFSNQPLSVAKLPAGTKPFFRDPKNKITLQSLADETDLIVQQFRAQGVKNIIPVSLSFSGGVTPFLKGYPLIIETAPMTSSDATNPELAKNIKLLKRFEIFNPIFGPAINRNLIDKAYRTNWEAQVKRVSEGYNLPKDKAEDMIEGYMAMSRAAEGFDWSQVDLPKETQRAFIIGENESPELFISQAKTFLRLSRERKNVSFFLVGGAGHIVSVDQPVAYSILLGNILGPQQYNVEKTGGAIFDPVAKQFKFMSREEMENFVEDCIKHVESQKSQE